MRRGVPLRRTGLRRTPVKRWQRAEEDKVSPELHDYVMARDRVCLAFRLDPEHRCFDRWGNEHKPDDTRRLTLDHVKDEARTGVRAPSDKYHLLALCGRANNDGWASSHREEERAYLKRVEP